MWEDKIGHKLPRLTITDNDLLAAADGSFFFPYLHPFLSSFPLYKCFLFCLFVYIFCHESHCENLQSTWTVSIDYPYLWADVDKKFYKWENSIFFYTFIKSHLETCRCSKLLNPKWTFFFLNYQFIVFKISKIQNKIAY